MGYLGTCVVCREAITDTHDLAWLPALAPDRARRRAHRKCAHVAEVQDGPTIEGARPAARDHEARAAWIIARSRAADRGLPALDVLAHELEVWLDELKASPSDRGEKGGR